MAEHIYTYINPTKPAHLQMAQHILSRDGIVALPMDVNWALCCLSTSRKAIERLLRLKPGQQNIQTKLLSLICSDISMAARYGQIDNSAYRLLKSIFPGPYTVILERTQNVARQLKDKRKTVGIRIPKSPLVLDLVHLIDIPLVASSIPPTKKYPEFHQGFEIADAYDKQIDLILDLGESLEGLETTIIDLTEGQATIVREGAGSVEGLL